jgi:hypothetical protein
MVTKGEGEPLCRTVFSTHPGSQRYPSPRPRNPRRLHKSLNVRCSIDLPPCWALPGFVVGRYFFLPSAELTTICTVQPNVSSVLCSLPPPHRLKPVWSLMELFPDFLSYGRPVSNAAFLYNFPTFPWAMFRLFCILTLTQPNATTAYSTLHPPPTANPSPRHPNHHTSRRCRSRSLSVLLLGQ